MNTLKTVLNIKFWVQGLLWEKSWIHMWYIIRFPRSRSPTAVENGCVTWPAPRFICFSFKFNFEKNKSLKIFDIVTSIEVKDVNCWPPCRILYPEDCRKPFYSGLAKNLSTFKLIASSKMALTFWLSSHSKVIQPKQFTKKMCASDPSVVDTVVFRDQAARIGWQLKRNVKGVNQGDHR